eukprot:6176849-Pleurochrysis_carterae.AAC.3
MWHYERGAKVRAIAKVQTPPTRERGASSRRQRGSRVARASSPPTHDFLPSLLTGMALPQAELLGSSSSWEFSINPQQLLLVITKSSWVVLAAGESGAAQESSWGFRIAITTSLLPNSYREAPSSWAPLAHGA